MDMSPYAPWAGRTETRREPLDPWPVRGLLALLDDERQPAAGEAAPLLAQWLWFAPMVPQAQIDEDGHPKRGGFLPPVELPRRMWAGSDITFHAPMVLGAEVAKSMIIADISLKQGGSGPLVFVNVDNAYREAGTDRLLLEERQILVYREPPAPGAPAPKGRSAPSSSAWSEAATISTARMFRYSAVTFNAHRIHYDTDYTRDVEGYPGTLVQGQLLATLMLRAWQNANPGTAPATFSFRGMQPVFAGEAIHLEGAPGEGGGWDLWVRDDAGVLRMSGTVG